MTYSACLVATLPFGLPEEPASEGLFALFEDGTIRLVPSDATRAEFEAFSGSMDRQTLAWGASLLVGLAGLGAALWFRERRGPACVLFGLSGLMGVGGSFARREASRIGAVLTSPHLLGRQAWIVRGASGTLALQIRESGLPPLVIRLASDEFDIESADAFLQAVAVRVPGGVLTG